MTSQKLYKWSKPKSPASLPSPTKLPRNVDDIETSDKTRYEIMRYEILIDKGQYEYMNPKFTTHVITFRCCSQKSVL